MKQSRLFHFVILGIATVSACSDDLYDPYIIPSGTSEITLEASQFNAIKPFAFDSEDKVSLVFSTESVKFKPYTLNEIDKLKNGTSRDVLIVNPSKDGRVLGYDGESEVRNNLGMVAMSAGKDKVQSNLSAITTSLSYLVGYPEYVFSLSRDKNGYKIRHKSSGFSFTDKGEKKESSTGCVWSENAGNVSFADASNVTGDMSLVTGSKYQVFIKSEGLCLYSGKAFGKLGWYENGKSEPNMNTSWMVFPIPLKNFEYSLKDISNGTYTFLGTEYDPDVDCYVLYPSNNKANLNEGKINFTIPEKRNYVENGVAKSSDIRVGKLDSKNGNVVMDNVFGIVGIPVKGSQTLLELDITDKSGASIWGNAVMDVQTYEFVSIDYGSSTCAVKCYLEGGIKLDKDQAHMFYTVLPAGSLKQGYSVKVITLDGSSAYEFAGTDVKRGEVTILSTISVL